MPTKAITKKRYPLGDRLERPQPPPWRCAGCTSVVTEGTKPLCRICRSKGRGIGLLAVSVAGVVAGVWRENVLPGPPAPMGVRLCPVAQSASRVEACVISCNPGGRVVAPFRVGKRWDAHAGAVGDSLPLPQGGWAHGWPCGVSIAFV